MPRNNIEKNFATSYEAEEGNLIELKFRTREQNDAYAEGLELMGVKDITKSYWDELTRKWLPYTKQIFRTERL